MASLPKSEWVSLSVAWNEAVSAFPDDDAGEIESALLNAFADGKVRTKGRCRSYREHAMIAPIDQHIFEDPSQIIVKEDEESFWYRDSSKRVHVFSNVIVHRRSLERCFHPQESIIEREPPATSHVARRGDADTSPVAEYVSRQNKQETVKKYIAQNYPNGLPAHVTQKAIARECKVDPRTVRRALGGK